MSRLVYLDTNVYDDLVKRTDGATEADESRLLAAASSGQVTILVSYVNIRETLAALLTRPDITRSQLRLILCLADWTRFVRFSTDLLESDVRHFAFNGEPANSPFEDDETAAHIRSVSQKVIDERLGVKELEAVIREDFQQKRAFLTGAREARAQTRLGLEELKTKNEIPSFGEWFKSDSESYALAFVKSYDVADECKRRSLDRLLKIPSLRALIGLGMSFIYRVAVENKAPRGSDSRDIQHAVCAAAAADIFVTHDKELAILLARVPGNRLRVMTLNQLLFTEQ